VSIHKLRPEKGRPQSRGWSRVGALGLAGVSLFVASEAAFAAVGGSRHRQQSSPVKREPAPKPPQGPLLAVISLANQHVNIYGSGGHMLNSRISTGQPGHRTPTGVFSVIQKQRYHESNIYSGAPMPYMQRITWSGIAMHEGVVPNYPASHGCIRLPGSFASHLFGVTKVGMRVVIAPGDVSPQEITHTSLFVPRPAKVETGINAGAAPVQVASNGAATEPVVPYDPLKAAEELKALAARRVGEAAKAVAAALAESQARSAEANRAADTLRLAEAAKAAADARLEAAKRDLATASNPETETAAKTKVATLEAAALEAGKERDRVKAEENAKSDAAFAAVAAYKTAEAGKAAAEAAAKDAARKTEPVSVFISRKEGKLFVRQAFDPVLEVPVTIQNADQPLGTHVFTAMAVKAGGGAMNWVVVTIPSSGVIDAPQPRHGKVRNRGEDDGRVVTAAVSRPTSAGSALDRISIPKEAAERISELLLPGASLIVSDYGISHETGKGTDFVVLTH